MTPPTEGKHTGGFTPGPWSASVWERHVFVAGGPNNDDIAEFNFCDESTVSISKDEAIANAILFASAPDLLEALERVANAWPESPSGESYDMMLAAISKATGAP